jgi:glucokinase
MTGPVVAIDLGGTRVKVGIVADGAVTRRAMVPSDSATGLRPKLPVLRALVDDLLAGQQPAAVGIALPGIVDRRTRRLLAINAKWSDAPDMDLAGWVRDNWGTTLIVENDAVSALAGEWHHGAGKGCDGVVMLTLGTGIGAAAVVDGRLLRGSHGQAAIAGHLTVEANGRICTCGNRGCAEAEASMSVLPELAQADSRFATSDLAAAATLDYAAVFDLADRDPLSRDLRDRALRIWSALSVSVIHAYDPEVLVIGGGVAAAEEQLFGPIAEYVAQHAWTPWGSVAIEPSQCGVDAAVLGLAAIAEVD